MLYKSSLFLKYIFYLTLLVSFRHSLSIAATVSEAENAYVLATWFSESRELLRSFKINETTPSPAKIKKKRIKAPKCVLKSKQTCSQPLVFFFVDAVGEQYHYLGFNDEEG